MDFDLSSVVEVVGGFVARTRGVPGDSVRATTLLFQEGLLDSFAVAELIAELAAAFGASWEEGTLLPQDFESPQVLFERLQQL
jgi:acyl carrier protein